MAVVHDQLFVDFPCRTLPGTGAHDVPDDVVGPHRCGSILGAKDLDGARDLIAQLKRPGKVPRSERISRNVA